MEWRKKFLRLKTIPQVATYVGFLLYLVCFATPAWIGYSNDVKKVTTGLFLECQEGSGCSSVGKKDADKLVVAQVFGCLGFVSYLALVVSSSITFFKEETWKAMSTLKNANYIAAIAAGTFVTVAHLLLLQHKASQNSSLRYSGIMGVISAFGALILSLIYIRDSRQTTPKKKEPTIDLPKNVPPTAFPVTGSDRVWQPRREASSPVVCFDNDLNNTATKGILVQSNAIVQFKQRDGTLTDIKIHDNKTDAQQTSAKLLPVVNKANNPPTIYTNQGFDLDDDDVDLFAVVTDRYNQPMTPFPDDKFRRLNVPLQAFTDKEPEIHHVDDGVGHRDNACLTPVSQFTGCSHADRDNMVALNNQFKDDINDQYSENEFSDEEIRVHNDEENSDDHKTKNETINDEDFDKEMNELENLFSVNNFNDFNDRNPVEVEEDPTALPVARTTQLYANYEDESFA